MIKLPSESEVGTDLKEVMRVFPQGVTVVTCRSGGGPNGITVSAFTSVSMDPPLVLIAISKKSSVHDVLAHSKGFAVNFLADDQRLVSERFAGRLDAKDRFDGIEFEEGATGSPILRGVRAVVECALWRAYDGGDHSILVGRVMRAKKMSDRPPLVFYDQQYTSTGGKEATEPSLDTMW